MTLRSGCRKQTGDHVRIRSNPVGGPGHDFGESAHGYLYRRRQGFGAVFHPGVTMANFVIAHGLKNCTALRIIWRNAAKMIVQMRLHLPLRFDQEAHTPLVTQQS